MTGPGPNDVLPCGTESCRLWHIAHSYGEHDCAVHLPVASRVERRPLKAVTRRWPERLADDAVRGGAAGVA